MTAVRIALHVLAAVCVAACVMVLAMFAVPQLPWVAPAAFWLTFPASWCVTHSE